MFYNKLVLIAATVALALSSISASQQSATHLRVHSQSKGGAVCSSPGQSSMSVEGIEGVYCAAGQPCVADVSNGTCPGAEPRLPHGFVCGKVKTSVFGCKPLYTGGGDKVTPMSVEGVEGIFCVSGTACAGQDGVCPGPQGRLEHGSYCGAVKTGVLGCKPVMPADVNTESASEDATEGDSEDSKESLDKRRRRF